MTAQLLTIQNGIPKVSSLQIAKHFNKQHKNVLKAIQALIADTPNDFNGLNFELVKYHDEKGEERPMYWLTRIS